MKKQMQNNIDISTNTYLNPYKCKQGDIIKWIVDLSDLGASVDLTGRTVICNIVKANNTFLKQTSNITITGSKIDITLDQQATQIPGQTKLSLTISKTGEKATTFSKVLEVEKNDTEDLIPSTNIVTIIDQLDAKILEANNTKTALDTSIANGNVAKIRADVDKNTTDIATNKTNITKNTTDITVNATNITKNTTDITKNTNDITFLNTEVFNAKEGKPTLLANMQDKTKKGFTDYSADVLTLNSSLKYESAVLNSFTKDNNNLVVINFSVNKTADNNIPLGSSNPIFILPPAIRPLKIKYIQLLLHRKESGVIVRVVDWGFINPEGQVVCMDSNNKLACTRVDLLDTTCYYV